MTETRQQTHDRLEQVCRHLRAAQHAALRLPEVPVERWPGDGVPDGPLDLTAMLRRELSDCLFSAEWALEAFDHPDGGGDPPIKTPEAEGLGR